MEKMRTLGDYQVLRLLPPTAHTTHHYKVKRNAKIHRLTALPLTPDIQTHRIQQLLRKCHKYKDLSHPNVEIITDVFHLHIDAAHFLAIVGEYSNEGDLEDLIQQDATRKSPELRQIMIDLCSGLEYLHSHSVIHKAITPETIRKIGGKYKITFPSFREISWFNSKSLSKPSHLLDNSAYYTSPELQTQAFFNSSTDVWSLGIIFYELLSGKQFRLCESKLPYEMGSFTEIMLIDIKNGMMRAMVKQMLNADCRARIGINRVRNIISNTDISCEDSDIEEEIVENRKYHTFILPLFPQLFHAQPIVHSVQGECNFLQVTLDKFQVVIIYKNATDTLEFCVYSTQLSHQIMSEYHFQQMQGAFASIFTSSREIFQELKRETLCIANINNFGQIALVLEQQRYMTLQRREKKLDPHKGEVLIYESTGSSKKCQPMFKEQSDEREQLYLQTVAEYGEESQQALEMLQELSESERFDGGSMEKAIQYQEKVLDLLIKQDRNLTNFQKIYQSEIKLTQRCLISQNYYKCIQINQKMFNYLIHKRIVNLLYEFIGKNIACCEILSDQQLLSKWEGLRDEYCESAIPCLIRTAMMLFRAIGDELSEMMTDVIIITKLDAYEERIKQEVNQLQYIPETLLEELLKIILIIFRYSYVRLYELASYLLTRIYAQIKKSTFHRQKQMKANIIKELTDLTNSAFSPKLKKVLREWVHNNMPQNSSKIFSSRRSFSFLDAFYQ